MAWLQDNFWGRVKPLKEVRLGDWECEVPSL